MMYGLRFRLPWLACLVGWFAVLSTANAQQIASVSESGTGLDFAGVYFTGQEFDHEVFGFFTVPTLDEDVPFFSDRNHEYNGVSEDNTIFDLGWEGVEYIMTANDNRGVADYTMDIELARTSDVYVLMDQRVTQPQWLVDEGWNYTGYEVGIDEGADGFGPGQGINQRFHIWGKFDLAPGMITTYERGGTGNNMYGVVVTQPGVGPGIKDFGEFPGADWVPSNFGLIDIGADGGQPDKNVLLDTDGLGQIGAAANNQNGINLDAREMTSKLGDKFTIAIDNIDDNEVPVGNLDWRDRGDNLIAEQLDLPLIRVGEDFVKNNAGVVRVTLGGLPSGPYEVTSFHMDPSFTQSEAIEILVDVGDGKGFVNTNVMGDANFHDTGVVNLTPQLVLDSAATFSFTADGTNDVLILFDGRFATDTEVPLSGLDIKFLGDVGLLGDYNGNGILDAEDPDFIISNLGTNNPTYDVNGDGTVTTQDLEDWIKRDDYAKTWVGDANVDGEFRSDDFITVFLAGKYETGEKAKYGEGDWNGDGLFTSNDFVAAFLDGGYEGGPRTAVASVPEPAGFALLSLGLLSLLAIRRRVD